MSQVVLSFDHTALPGTFAVHARSLYMDRDQLAELAAADALGTHAHQHVPLAALPASGVERQVRESLDLLEEWTGRRPFAMSYPYGGRESCSRDVGDAVRRCGVEFAFTMERAGNRDLAHPAQLARFDCNDVPGGKRPLAEGAEFFERIPVAAWFRETGGS